MEVVVVLLVAAVVYFLLEAFRVPAGVNWTPLAWAFVVAATVVYLWDTTRVFRD